MFDLTNLMFQTSAACQINCGSLLMYRYLGDSAIVQKRCQSRKMKKKLAILVLHEDHIAKILTLWIQMD